jgi:transcriptional regulator with XRE-family HTH domain
MDFKTALYRIIGDRIKVKRIAQGLSQDEVSKYLKLSRSSISNMEIGRHQIPLFLLYELSYYFKTNIHDLIPTYEEVLEFVNSEIKDYSGFLDGKNFNEDEKQSLEKVLSTIGKK